MDDNYIDPVIKVDLNINYNINNIISTANFNTIKNISTKSESDKEEYAQKKILIGPRMKHQKKNKTEDIELQIACEDEEERKERLNQEKEKKKEMELKNKNLIYKIDEENYHCIDCGNSPSNFISINNGVTLCNECAKIHKKFGNNISYVLNINDELDEYLFNFIVFGSNSKFKKFLENENVDKNLNSKKKYKINAVVFYRKNLKNKVEGKKLEEKFYENPNDVDENIEENDEYPEFNDYIIKKRLIKNGEMKKQNKLISLFSNLFSKKNNNNKNKLLLRTKSTVKEKFIIKENINDKIINKNMNNNKISMNKKKYKNSLNFESKIKESSRPLDEEKTDPDKNGESESNGQQRIQSTSEHMISKANDIKK